MTGIEIRKKKTTTTTKGTTESMKAAHNAKVLTTGIAIASTLGISTGYTINANAQILEKIEAAQTTVSVDPALVANTPVVAPTTPSPATPAGPKNKKVKTTTPTIAVDTPAIVDANPAVTIAPAPLETPPTTAPATSSSK